jgi:hypothetical protein
MLPIQSDGSGDIVAWRMIDPEERDPGIEVCGLPSK